MGGRRGKGGIAVPVSQAVAQFLPLPRSRAHRSAAFVAVPMNGVHALERLRCPPSLPATHPVRLQPQESNARAMATARGRLLIPWDLHPRSLHAEFAHNTDVLFTLGPGVAVR